jgi:hypothetical protein
MPVQVLAVQAVGAHHQLKQPATALLQPQLVVAVAVAAVAQVKVAVAAVQPAAQLQRQR